MDHPHPQCALEALAQACDDRAAELQACAWRSESERNALRADTAALLANVARQLCVVGAAGVAPTQLLGSSDLRRIIDTQVVHAPLAATRAHPWREDVVPGTKGSAAPSE